LVDPTAWEMVKSQFATSPTEWMSQIVISNKEKMGLRKKPCAFTEQVVAMLAGVLKARLQ